MLMVKPGTQTDCSMSGVCATTQSSRISIHLQDQNAACIQFVSEVYEFISVCVCGLDIKLCQMTVVKRMALCLAETIYSHGCTHAA